MNRRKFIEKAGAVSAAGILVPTALHGFSINKMKNPNSRIAIGVVGCNGMGWSNVSSLLKMEDVDLVAICDVDKNVIERRLADYAKLRTNKPKTFTDYRELLKLKDIDAVVIGTPDHWHCKIMVDAVQAGKHVYVEKPIANTIEECYLMTSAAEKTGMVVQTGQWQRSGPHYQKAFEIVKSGVLGNIRLVKAWAYQGWMKPVPIVPDSPVPEGVDYDFWLGMATRRPFNQNRFHFNFRWFWDYAGGLMTDWGVHEIDIAVYAMQATTPRSVMASGGKIAYPDDASETPDTLQAIYEFDGFNMLWEHATGIDTGPYNRREGIAFIGNNGTIVVDRGGYEVFVERESVGYSSSGPAKMESIESFKVPSGDSYLDRHTRNFIEGVKAKDSSRLNTPIASGALAAINAQMGNIAFRTNSKVFWDANSKSFVNNEEANRLIHPVYQNGWKLPTV